MTIEVSREELELIVKALNVAGAVFPECDDLADELVYGNRCQGE